MTKLILEREMPVRAPRTPEDERVPAEPVADRGVRGTGSDLDRVGLASDRVIADAGSAGASPGAVAEPVGDPSADPAATSIDCATRRSPAGRTTGPDAGPSTGAIAGAVAVAATGKPARRTAGPSARRAAPSADSSGTTSGERSGVTGEAGTLWGRYVRCGARVDRDRLVLHYEPLVRQVAGRVGTWLPPHVDLADLVQAGVFGLMDAIERFEPEMGVRFESYASQRIRGAILDELRAQDWVPRIVRNRARELARARETLEARLQRTVSPAELARELGVGLAEIRSILDQIHLISMEAADEWAAARGLAPKVADTLAMEDSDPVLLLEDRETRRLLGLSLERLSERDRQVLRQYYVDNLTLAEIGRRLGVTESRVCQLRARAVTRLRERFGELAGSVTRAAPAT